MKPCENINNIFLFWRLNTRVQHYKHVMSAQAVGKTFNLKYGFPKPFVYLAEYLNCKN